MRAAEATLLRSSGSGRYVAIGTSAMPLLEKAPPSGSTITISSRWPASSIDRSRLWK